MPPRPQISSQYEYSHQHWYFIRDSKLPHGTFDKPFEQRAGEWAAVAVCAVALAAAISVATYFLF